MRLAPQQPSLRGRRVLLLAEYITSGGTRTYVEALLRFYANEGSQVTLVSTLEDPDPSMERLVQRFGFAYVTYSRALIQGGWNRKRDPSRSPQVWSLPYMRDERRCFRQLCEQLGIDILVVSAGTPGMFAGASGSCANSLYILHTYPHGRRQKWLARPYLAWFFPKHVRFVAVSRFEASIMRRLWRLSEDRVDVILSASGPVASNHSTHAEPWMVLTVAGAVYYKQPFLWVDVAREVARRLPGHAIRFVWLGEGELLESARRYAADNPDVDVQFPGLSRDVESYYQEARVYLQLSSIENFSLAVLDAQRHGVPSVVSDVGGLPEIVEHGITGYVCQGSLVATASQMVAQLLTQSRLWDSMSAAARLRYAERFSPEHWKARMLAAHAFEATHR